MIALLVLSWPSSTQKKSAFVGEAYFAISNVWQVAYSLSAFSISRPEFTVFTTTLEGAALTTRFRPDASHSPLAQQLWGKASRHSYARFARDRPE
jgi:hypothetical protein